jgi:hypothetical protein
MSLQMEQTALEGQEIDVVQRVVCKMAIRMPLYRDTTDTARQRMFKTIRRTVEGLAITADDEDSRRWRG